MPVMLYYCTACFLPSRQERRLPADALQRLTYAHRRLCKATTGIPVMVKAGGQKQLQALWVLVGPDGVQWHLKQSGGAGLAPDDADEAQVAA